MVLSSKPNQLLSLQQIVTSIGILCKFVNLIIFVVRGVATMGLGKGTSCAGT